MKQICEPHIFWRGQTGALRTAMKRSTSRPFQIKHVSMKMFESSVYV